MACLLFCAQVRQTIGKLKEKFEENLRDRDDVNAKKMERLSKQKDAGRFTLKTAQSPLFNMYHFSFRL